jgi:hypothetical protein
MELGSRGIVSQFRPDILKLQFEKYSNIFLHIVRHELWTFLHNDVRLRLFYRHPFHPSFDELFNLYLS